MKLDMEKAYYRVSWSYICTVLMKIGFDEVFIDMVWIDILLLLMGSDMVSSTQLEISSKVTPSPLPYLF